MKRLLPKYLFAFPISVVKEGSSWQARNTFCIEFKWRSLENKYFGSLLQSCLLTRKIKNFCNSPVCNTAALKGVLRCTLKWKSSIQLHSPHQKKFLLFLIKEEEHPSNSTPGEAKSLPTKDEFRAFKAKILLRHWIRLVQSEAPESEPDFTWGQFAAQRSGCNGCHHGSTGYKWAQDG